MTTGKYEYMRGSLVYLFNGIYKGGYIMPVRKVKGGYKWGSKGKVYKSKAKALKQGRAIQMSKRKKK